jgi:hypothetical protein
MSLKCPKCSRPLEPTVLKPQSELWCSVCATRFDMEGKPLEPATAAPVLKLVDYVNQKTVEQAPKVSDVGSQSAKGFHVVVGDVAFDCVERVDLTIGSTKVTIT